jgi:NADH-quinone oxidoreductase subunit F
VEAIAAGKQAAASIDRFLRGQPLEKSNGHRLPSVYIAPSAMAGDDAEEAERVEAATLPAASRQKNFTEVEMTLSADQAVREARRCLRCDLRFTQPANDKAAPCAAETQLA